MKYEEIQVLLFTLSMYAWPGLSYTDEKKALTCGSFDNHVVIPLSSSRRRLMA